MASLIWSWVSYVPTTVRFLLSSLGFRAEPETKAQKMVPRSGWGSRWSETGKENSWHGLHNQLFPVLSSLDSVPPQGQVDNASQLSCYRTETFDTPPLFLPWTGIESPIILHFENDFGLDKLDSQALEKVLRQRRGDPLAWRESMCICIAD